MQVIVHDYETTGVKPRVCGVVQSAIWIVKFAEDGSYEILAHEVAHHNPGAPIPDGASAVHGIYDHMVEHLPLFTDSLASTMNEAFEAFSIDAVMGYNNTTFDNVIAHRFGLPEDKLVNIDLYPVMRKLKARGFMDSAKLGSAYTALTGDENTDKAHDAEFDLEMTCALVPPAMKILGCETFAEFVTYINTPEVNPDMLMPFGKHKDKPLREVPFSYRRWLCRDQGANIDADLYASLQAVANGS